MPTICAFFGVITSKAVLAIEKTDTASFSIQESPSLSVSISSSSVVLDVKPTPYGQFGRVPITVDVSTNNTTGYNLTMSADVTSLSRTSAVSGAIPEIPTLPEAFTCTDETESSCDLFPNGYWGYKIGEDNSRYLPATTSGSIIATTYSASNSNKTTVYLATKLNNEKPTGTYSGVNISFVATTNPVPFYMQDVDKNILDIFVSNVGDTVVLRDRRDEQDYTISKLADNSYWMTDNLNLAGGKQLSTSDTNIQTSYTLPSSNISGSMICNTGDDSYYSYNVAVAESNVGANTHAKYDICPLGWRLPSASDYNRLQQEYSTVSLLSSAPVNLRAKGYIAPGASSIYNNNIMAVYWESNANGAESALSFYYESDNQTSARQASYGRSLMGSIRCIFSGE